MKTDLEPWKSNLEPWKTIKTNLNHWKPIKTEMEPWKTNLEPSKLTWSCRGWLWGVQVVTGDSQEEVIIFRDKQTHMHHNIYIAIITSILIAIIINSTEDDIWDIWRRYFISWQIFENKVWCPVSKKRRGHFHFLLSLAYPIDRLDWALFIVVILFHHIGFLYWRNWDLGLYFAPQLPRGFDHFYRTGRGTSPSPQCGAGREPPLPAGRVPCGAGRPSLIYIETFET